MQLETFKGQNLAEVIAMTRNALGDEAMIVSTRIDDTEDGRCVEIVAARPADIDSLREQLDGGQVPSRSLGDRIRPYTIALVGPPGAGKTTTAIKLALHPRALGDRKVGLITLDTYRVGAMDEMSTYADIAALPLEIAYNQKDLVGAMKRLGSREAIIVDTPGRAEGAGPRSEDWVDMVRTLQPDEIHLVLPAGLRTEVAEKIATTFVPIRPTHLLLSKTDQLAGDSGLASIPQALNLPIRWLATGQDVPGSLALAGPKVLGALALSGDEAAWARMVG